MKHRYNNDDTNLKNAIMNSRNINASNTKSYVESIGEDRIYYNVTIANNNAISINGAPIRANFQEVRSDNLFNGLPEEYSMSVVRFTVPSQYIPLYIFPVIENPSNPSDPNFGLQSVCLSYNNVDFKTNLVFIPQNSFVQIPPAPSSVPIAVARRNQYYEYYSIFSIQWMVDIINTALQTSFNNLKSAFPGAAPTAAPFLSYTAATSLFTLYAQPSYSTDQALPYVQIYFNHYLYQLFETSFEVINNGYVSTFGNQEKDIQLIIKNKLTNNVTLPAPQGTVYAMTQDYNTIPNWSPFTSIVFTTGSLPIRSEWLSGEKLNGRDLNGTLSESFRRVLTDFESDSLTGFENRTYIRYVPTAEYRRIDVFGKSPIRNIDIQVFWKDNYDNYYPIMIPAYYELSIKILFERKR